MFLTIYMLHILSCWMGWSDFLTNLIRYAWNARIRGAQPFGGQGPQCITLSALKGRDEIMIWTFESQVKSRFFYLTSLFDACGLILMLSELFRIVMSCKIVNSSMKFKFFLKSPSFTGSSFYSLTCCEGLILHVRWVAGVHPCPRWINVFRFDKGGWVGSWALVSLLFKSSYIVHEVSSHHWGTAVIDAIVIYN